MYYETVAPNFETMASEIRDFAVNRCGFTLYSDGNVALSCTNNIDYTAMLVTTNQSLINTTIENGQGDVVNENLASVRRIVLQDGIYFYSLFFFRSPNLTQWYGTGNTGVVECWISTSAPGSAANSGGGIIKGGLISGLPNDITQMYLFGGQNPDGTRYIHYVCENIPGTYQHLSFGMCAKLFNFSGGQYVACSANTALDGAAPYYVYDMPFSAPFGAQLRIHRYGALPGLTMRVGLFTDYNLDDGIPTSQWHCIAHSHGVATGATLETYNYSGYYAGMRAKRLVPSFMQTSAFFSSTSGGTLYNPWYNPMAFPENSWTSINPMLPLWVGITNPESGGTLNTLYTSMIGSFSGVRIMNMGTMIGGDEINFGSDIWKVFPARTKADSGGQYGQSAGFGYAYLK